MKSLFTPSLFNLSIPYLSISNPSILKPSVSLVMVSLMNKNKWMIVDNIFLGLQKSGTKSRGVLYFVPLRRFYDALFVPLFCRLREKCGILWKTTWLHNVDNIRQKDIKTVKSPATFLTNCTFTLQASVADPWYFGVDPDPRIHASD